MSEVIVTVRGEHETRLAPEQGVVHVTLHVEGRDRGGVVERIAALAAPLREDLTARDAAGTVVEWSSQRVSVWSERPWNAEGKQLAPVHHASVEYLVTFDDFTALSWWVSEIADRDGVQIGWIEWRLTPPTRATVEREVAAEAVTVAVTRATAYAGALGLDTLTPLEIADLGLLTRNEASPGASPKMLRAASFMADAGGGSAMQLQPEDITVTAAVEARFAAR